MIVEAYADGSATTQDKAGGWGGVVVVDGFPHKELSGHLDSATNNDAELIGAIEVLKYTKAFLVGEAEVFLVSDSQIILNWANGSYRFKQLEKIHLYNELRDLVKAMKVKTRWVKGHNGDQWNERCDKLANRARRGISNELDKNGLCGDTRIGIKKAATICLYYGDILKIIDLEQNIVENYNRDIHGKRGSAIQIREEKDRT